MLVDRDEMTNGPEAPRDVAARGSGDDRVWRADAAHPPVVPPDDAWISDSWYVGCKMAAEWVAALALLVVAGPVMLLAALAVKLTSRGPAFYSQARLGRGGRTFR